MFTHFTIHVAFLPTRTCDMYLKIKIKIKRRYCVIVYVSHFWPPDFSLISVRYLLYRPTYLISKPIPPSVFHCAGNACVWVSKDCLYLWPWIAHTQCSNDGGGGRVHAGGKTSYEGMHTELFWRTIYFSKPRPDPGSYPRFRSRRGLGRQAPQIIREYNLAIAIAIWSLIHPRTCEMGSSIFSTTS